MIIDYVKMENYRQFVDQKIDLGITGNKRFIVIEGGMGTGKTNCLNAITWCLYGKEPHIGKKYRGLPIINTLVLNEMKTLDAKPVQVEIQLRGKKIKYRIKRTLWHSKSEDGTLEVLRRGNQQDGSNLEMWVQMGKNTWPAREPSRFIQRLIPEDIHEYFFFDGERLDDYFREEAGEKIKEAVDRISQLELLDRIIKHLDDTRGGLVRKSKRISPQTQQLIAQVDKKKKSLKEEEGKLDKLYKDKKEGEKHGREIRKELVESKESNIKELVAERDERESKIRQLEDELDELEGEYSKYLIERTPRVLGHKAVLQTWEIINKREEAGEIPPDFKRNFLKKLLDEGSCICGTDISKENSHRSKIRGLLDECDEITNITDELIKLYAGLDQVMLDVTRFPTKYIEYGKRIRQLNEEIRNNSEKVENIKEKIKGSDIERIRRLEEKWEEYTEKIGKANEEIGMTKSVIKSIKKNIEALEGEIQKEIAKGEKLKTLRKQLELCNPAVNAVHRIKDEIMQQTRQSIEAKTKKQFLEMGWKKKTFADLTIDDQYNISLKDQSGLEAIGTLSAGERQILALSFIEPLNVVSGFDVPIIIDTPLGRIAEEPTINIAEHLPNYFEEKQVMLFVTDKEYSPEVRAALSKVVHKEYEIKFKETEKGGVAEVVPYGK